MKVLVTGAKGFIGRNLVATLKNKTEISDVFECDVDTTKDELEYFCRETSFVYHLAGVNRTDNTDDFQNTNVVFTEHLLTLLKKYENKAPVLLSSSIQADNMTPYGISKRAAEETLKAYGVAENVRTYIYRLPNVFGKWSRPDYNSVIATFCNNIARNRPIRLNQPEKIIRFVYIDDVVSAFVKMMNKSGEVSCAVSPYYDVTLDDVAKLLFSFKTSRKTYRVPKLSDEFAKKLYATYLSYLPETSFTYDLVTHADNRGVFAEVLKSDICGQISINSVKPGQTKGNHWHNTKTEKFVAVSGEGNIVFRKIGSDERSVYHLSAEKAEVIDVPPGYTHAVENTGEIDFVTVIWASEIYDPDAPDTYYEEV